MGTLMKVKVLEELVGLVNHRQPAPIARYFTENFRLDDAGAGVVRTGHAGTEAMIDDFPWRRTFALKCWTRSRRQIALPCAGVLLARGRLIRST